MAWKKRPVTQKGRSSNRNKAIREIVREIAGYSPLESRMDELLKAGESSKDKKAVKIARQKLGTQKRALHKKNELQAIIQLQRKRN
jgi:DNA helicase IV